MNHSSIKSAYILDHLKQSTNPNINGVSFHFPLLGLHELTRQYFSLPDEIKIISGPLLIKTVKQIISKSNLIKFVENGTLNDKNIKKFSIILEMVKQIGSENSLNKLHKELYNPEFIKGIFRSLQKLVNNNNYPLKNCYKVIDELLLLLVEYMFYRGHSKESLYAQINYVYNTHRQDNLKSFTKIYTNLFNIVTNEIDSLPKIEVKFEFYKEKTNNQIANFKFLHTFIEKRLMQLKKENRISTYNKSDYFFHTEYYFNIYKIDQKYLEGVITDIYKLYELLSSRFDYLKDNMKIFLDGKIFVPIKESSNETINIKYLDSFLSNSNFIDMPEIIYHEIIKSLEWTSSNQINNDKKTNFMTLWSILEFLFIDSAVENKIESVANNFAPYLSLFYFRKKIKEFFKDILYSLNLNLKIGAQYIEQFIDNQFSNVGLNDLQSLELSNKFTIFLFTDKIKLDKKWVNFSSRLNEDYLIAKTISITTDLKTRIETFEDSIKNDIKQIYRLRNMLTHSGINDNKILDNTFFRLRYYVQTSLNTLSYNWSHNNTSSLSELHELKKFDCNQYKKIIEKINSEVKNKGQKYWINMVNYNNYAILQTTKCSFDSIIKKY